MKLHLNKLILVTAFCAALMGNAQAQTDEKERVNFDFTPNPTVKAKSVPKTVAVNAKKKDKESVESKKGAASKVSEKPSIKETPEKADTKTSTGPDREHARSGRVKGQYASILSAQKALEMKPSETYSVGIGDVLMIGIMGSRSSQFEVDKEGNIDYPLAGGLIPVKGLIVTNIETILRSNIALFEKPRVQVQVLRRTSHKVTVEGAVGRPGRRTLLRDAMPLFVLRAQSMVTPKARMAIIYRGSDELRLKLGTPEFDETLVMPGDRVKFVSVEDMPKRFAFVEGKKVEDGKYELREGWTLTKLVFHVAGADNSEVSKAVIKRTDSNGKVRSTKYKMSSISRGKTKDPIIEDGDIVELKR